MCSCHPVLMALLYRARHSESERWIMPVVLSVLVPPCGWVAILCLAFAHRARRNCTNNTSTAACLERISYASVVIAVTLLLAANFFALLLYRTHLLAYLKSSRCSAVGVSRDGTFWSPTVESFPSDSQVNVDHRLIKQRFVLSNKPSVLQSPIDVEFSLINHNVNAMSILPMHQNHHTDSSFTSSKP